MKKFVFSFFLFSLMVFSAQAQKAACCKPGGKSAAACHATVPSAASAETSAAAAKVAAMDQTIETRTDPITGTVSYVRKETAVADGSVSFVSLNFDPVTNSFVNVSPAMTEEGHNCATKATSASGKACTAKGTAAGKSCCAGKTATAATPKPEKIKS
ncbi:MAG TPA: hypothetical protein VFG10_20570 [Saprospiraceae bacterium]|nr:hypothetical protein [Saprospiraceae bacterium]